MKIFINIILALILAFVVNLVLVVFYQVPKQDYSNSITGSLSEKCSSDYSACFQKYPGTEYEATKRICGGFYEECFRQAQGSDPIQTHARNYFLIVSGIGLLLILIGIICSNLFYLGMSILLGGVFTSISSIYSIINSQSGWNNYINEYLILVAITVVLLIIKMIPFFVKRSKTKIS